MSSNTGNRLSELRKILATCIRELRTIKDELAHHPETETTFQSLQETITEIHQSYDAINSKRRRSEQALRPPVQTMTTRTEPSTSAGHVQEPMEITVTDGTVPLNVLPPHPRVQLRTELSDPMLKVITLRARSHVSLSFTLKTHQSGLTSLDEHIRSGSLPENMPSFAKCLIQSHAEMDDKVQCAKMLLLQRQKYLQNKILETEAKLTQLTNSLTADVENINSETGSSMNPNTIHQAFEKETHRITEEFLYKQLNDKLTKARISKQRTNKGNSPQAPGRHTLNPKGKPSNKKPSTSGKGRGAGKKVKLPAPLKSAGQKGKN